MKRALFLMIAALALTGCTIELPDLDPSALVHGTNAQAAAPPQNQPPASRYQADQSPDNTGDYSHYF